MNTDYRDKDYVIYGRRMKKISQRERLGLKKIEKAINFSYVQSKIFMSLLFYILYYIENQDLVYVD
jgi:hypothetical protein